MQMSVGYTIHGYASAPLTACQGVRSQEASRRAAAMLSRARISQIMNLLLLAPNIQEVIPFPPPTDGRRASI
jgi:hypothetical protein